LAVPCLRPSLLTLTHERWVNPLVPEAAFEQDAL
jgi:hypothetical protein